MQHKHLLYIYVDVALYKLSEDRLWYPMVTSQAGKEKKKWIIYDNAFARMGQDVFLFTENFSFAENPSPGQMFPNKILSPKARVRLKEIVPYFSFHFSLFT